MRVSKFLAPVLVLVMGIIIFTKVEGLEMERGAFKRRLMRFGDSGVESGVYRLGGMGGRSLVGGGWEMMGGGVNDRDKRPGWARLVMT